MNTCFSCSMGISSEWVHGHEDNEVSASVELNGDSAVLHNYVSGHESFDANIRRLKGSDGERAVGTWVTRPSMRQLREMVPLLQSLKARRWQLRAVHHSPNERLVPRLAMAATRTLQAATAARGAGIEVELIGFPRCMLGPYENLVRTEPARAFAESCAPCIKRSVCSGVHMSYLERFGDEDLRTLR